MTNEMKEFVNSPVGQNAIQEYLLVAKRITKLMWRDSYLNPKDIQVLQSLDLEKQTLHTKLLAAVGCKNPEKRFCCGKCSKQSCKQYELIFYIEELRGE